MTRRPLRLWTGALLVIAVLFLPQVSMAQGLSLSLPIEVQGGFSALWGLLVGIFHFQGDEADSRGTIDPDGEAAEQLKAGDRSARFPVGRFRLGCLLYALILPCRRRRRPAPRPHSSNMLSASSSDRGGNGGGLSSR